MCPQRAVLQCEGSVTTHPHKSSRATCLGMFAGSGGLFSHNINYKLANLYKGTVLMSSNREKVKIRRVTGGAVKKEILIGSRQNTMTSVQILNKYVGSLQRLLSSKELMCM